MLGVFVDTSYAQGPSNPTLPQSEPVFRCPSVLGKSTTQPHSHRPSVSSDRLQLSCFKLGVRVLLIALLAGGLAFSNDARQSLKLKRSARDKIVISQAAG
jgi:hypothetical protein